MTLLKNLWNKKGSITPPGTGFIRAETPEVLLQPHHQRIQRIRELVGLPDKYWHTLYYKFINELAAYVQLLPASEFHHHSEPGGLLNHILECMEISLKLRRGEMLPTGEPPEVVSEQQELWSYAIATAAALHDIGKPLSDQVIEYHDGHKFSVWKPLSRKMVPGAWYRFSHNPNREYRVHEVLPVLLAREFIPRDGFNWLSSNTRVLDEWASTLSHRSDRSGSIGGLVSKADQTSVASYLNNNQPSNLVTANTKRLTLPTQIAMTIRKLIDDGALPLNKPGAAGFIIEGNLWCVSKRVLDAIREQLLSDGVNSVPSNNINLMDELVQSGYIVTNKDKAIWSGTIQLGEWRQKFSLIRFHISKLWPNPETSPETCPDGLIEISDSMVEENKEIEDETSPQQAEIAHVAQNHDVVDEQTDPEPEDSLPEFIPDEENSSISLDEKTTLTENIKEDNNEGGKNIGVLFSEWLATSIEMGSLKMNNASAKVHIVNEGLLIISPIIFRSFAAKHNNTFKYNEVQNKFQNLKINKRNENGMNIWKYKVIGTENKVLKGFLIPDFIHALKIETEMPKANEKLKLIT